MLNAGGPWVLVDLSNVCRDKDLCRRGRRADLQAFRRLVKALDESPMVLGQLRAVADRSLFRLLEPDDKEAFRRLVKQQLVVESPMADDTLIEAAFTSGSPFEGAVIVSKDGFADFRIAYPAIQGSTKRFIDWRGSRGEGLSVRFRDMGHFTHMRISRKIEEGELKQRRIFHTTVRDRAVRQRYRCANEDCVQAKLWPDALPQLPEYDRRIDGFRCPGCGEPLELVGTRPPATQVVVYENDREACRLLLEEGDELVIGRDDRSGCVGIGNYIGADVAAELSRRHVQVALHDGVVQVQDLGSKNGTWAETRKGRFDRRKLSKGEDAPLARSTRVRLGSDVTLELSGRRNPFDGVRLGVQHTRADVDPRQTATGG